MSIGTLALVFVVPAFFIVFQTLEEKISGQPAAISNQQSEGKEEEK
jgi:hypothetical protein